MAWMPVPDKDSRLFTIDEYLALERTEEERHEYLLYGCAHAMAGESPDHGTICMNLSIHLGSQLLGMPCWAFKQRYEGALRTEPPPCGLLQGLFAYPDLVIVCGDRCYSMTRSAMCSSIPPFSSRCSPPRPRPSTGARSLTATVPGCHAH